MLAYNLIVMMWGAFVRATGSGAGCGDHWPTCNGTVVPRDPSIATMIEFSHRFTSAMAGVLAIVLVIWAFRAYKKGHRVRKAAVVTLILMIIEGGIGASLVKLQLVAENASMGRALGLGLHLMNTFLLLGAISLTAWWASTRPGGVSYAATKFTGWLRVGLIGMLILGASGAVTALGDTLFPSGSLAEGLKADFSPTSHLLIRLRIWHPTLAIAVGGFLAVLSGLLIASKVHPQTKLIAKLLIGAVLFQIAWGFLNVLALAPVWMQLVHLLTSDILWILVVLLFVSTHGAYAGYHPGWKLE